ncbi:hypothetical protein Vafri_13117 [Volvox africanus]|uniref:Uncharacterized protein n=1 Tax=Volvox africanus TaxID=51714 RepID=A0A8J4F267_9CHLO|nr:hypothetical protein Vafri_13117 [Volvox africanus]
MGAELPNNDVDDRIYELPSPTAAIEALRLLIAADTVPRGGLYAGFYCTSAAVRYEAIWLSVLREHVLKGGNCPIPPLDVAFAWFVHRQFPISYANCTIRRCGRAFHPSREAAFAFGNCQRQQNLQNEGGGKKGDVAPGTSTAELWNTVAGDIPVWPPPAAGTDFDLVTGNNDWRPTLSSQLATPMARFASLLHSWLRPHFLDPLFLDRARNRYGRFLEMLAAHPGLTLVPAADIALMWHTHLGLSGDYAAAAKAIAVQSGLDCGSGTNFRPMYLDLDGAPLRVAYNSTVRLYEQTYGESYDSPDTAWVRPSEPHPLAGTASPLSFALFRAFDDVPSAVTSGANVDDTGPDGDAPLSCSGRPLGLVHPSRRGSGRSGRSGALRIPNTPQAASNRLGTPRWRPHPRAGGHALYAAWLASTSASGFFDRQTCRGLCFRSSWSIKVGAVEKMVTPLVLLPYMRGVPDNSDHPFLKAVAQRRGLWLPPLKPLEEQGEEEAATGEREGEEQSEGGREVSGGSLEEAEVDSSKPGGGSGEKTSTAVGEGGYLSATGNGGSGASTSADGSGGADAGAGGSGGAGASGSGGAGASGSGGAGASGSGGAGASGSGGAGASGSGGAGASGSGGAGASGSGGAGASGSGGAGASGSSANVPAAATGSVGLIPTFASSTASQIPRDDTISASDLGTPQVRRHAGVVTSPQAARKTANSRSSKGAGGKGQRSMFSGSGFKLGDAEEFLDDPRMWGLRGLMEQIAAGEASRGDPLWGRTLREEDEELSEQGEEDSPPGCRTPGGLSPAGGTSSRRDLNSSGGDGRRGGDSGGGGDIEAVDGTNGGGRCFGGEGYDSTAPIWNILRKPEYAKRAKALFRHLWAELGRRGLEHPLLQQQKTEMA